MTAAGMITVTMMTTTKTIMMVEAAMTAGVMMEAAVMTAGVVVMNRLRRLLETKMAVTMKINETLIIIMETMEAAMTVGDITMERVTMIMRSRKKLMQ